MQTPPAVEPDQLDFLDADEVEDLIEESESTTDLDAFIRLRRLDNENYKLKTILSTWKAEQKSERDMREKYVRWLFSLLTCEVFFACMVFLAIGAGEVNVTEWQANTFFVAVFTKITGMVWLVLRYLFPSSGGQTQKLVDKL